MPILCAENNSEIKDRKELALAITTHFVGNGSRKVVEFIERLVGIKINSRHVLYRCLLIERSPRIATRAHCSSDIRLAYMRTVKCEVLSKLLDGKCSLRLDRGVVAAAVVLLVLVKR